MKADEPVALTRSPLNCEATIRGLSPAITKNGSFFVRTHFAIPEVDRRGWRLTVDGGAGRARQFTYGDLRRMPRVTVASTMECAGNGRTGFREPAKGEVRA